MDDVVRIWRDVFGPDGPPAAISTGQMVVRAGVVFVVGLAFLRVGGHRVLARYSAVDIVVAIVLGSLLSRVVSGTAPTLPTLAACATFVALQRLLAAVSIGSKGLGRLVKGTPHRLMADGRSLPHVATRLSISREDLEEAMRLAGYEPTSGSVAEMWLERDGRISVIPTKETKHEGHDHPPRP